MSVNFKDLRTSQDEAQRSVRDFVSTPQGIIEIYEPTVADIVDIIKIQRGESEESIPPEEVEIDGITVIKELFPLLTSLDLSELTDEEIQDTIENPSIHLLTVQQIVSQIVQEANKYYAQKVKTEIINAESTMAQVDLINTIPSIILNKSKFDGEANELYANVQKAEEELEKAIEEEKMIEKEIEAIKSKVVMEEIESDEGETEYEITKDEIEEVEE